MMLALTIDMDGPAEYAAIHGARAPACDPSMMYGAPLDRFVGLCESVDAAGTLFVIGRDLEGQTCDRVAELAARGFEVASHSWSHDYQLSRAAPMHIEDDLRRARAAHERVLGTPPVGFRAPGHHTSTSLLDALESTGFTYSSSALPSPPYYVVKAAVLAGYRAAGRASRAMLGSPRMALAPRDPYHPARAPYRRGSRPLVELPVSVATRARLPVTGASLVLAPDPVRRWWIRDLRGRAAIVLNLHAMDLVDPVRDGLPRRLAARQPELGIPVEDRLHVLGTVIAELARSHRPTTCAQLARTT